jgi:alpha-methylacyl-CoA racemase
VTGGGPLTGIRVVELAGLGPAPFASMLLADLGADVVRVDRAGAATGGPDDATRHDLLNRGKRSIAVDLKHPDGVEVVLAMVGAADVLVEGFRPGVAERLGIGPASCLARNPRLVYGRMTGWGQTGPLSAAAGHDIDYLALSGSLHPIGTASRPVPPLNLVADFGGGGMYLTVGVLAALLAAGRTGRGQVVDAAMVDGAAHLATMIHGMVSAGTWRTERRSNLLDGGAPFYDTYETADGGHVAVGALEPRFFAEFVDRLGLDAAELPAQMDRAGWPRMREAFATRIRSRTRDAWTEVFDGTDACVAPVLSLTEAPEHPHLAARSTFVDMDGVIQPGPAPRFSETPVGIRSGPCHPGAHSREILLELGYEEPAIDRLFGEAAVR